MTLEWAPIAPRISHTQVKVSRGAPMLAVDVLDLRPLGVTETLPDGRLSPRQLTIASAESLDELGITAAGSRANIVLAGCRDTLRSGARVVIGPATLRITMVCEPCGYGARLAGVPLSRFRRLERFLAVVVSAGQCSPGDEVNIEPRAWEAAPATFPERACWAACRIPAGFVVSSAEFLTAIGASASYFRALPGWLRRAKRCGAPVHRVLATHFTVPSWEPECVHLLQEEGLSPADYSHVQYPLVRATWFVDGLYGRPRPVLSGPRANVVHA